MDIVPRTPPEISSKIYLQEVSSRINSPKDISSEITPKRHGT